MPTLLSYAEILVGGEGQNISGLVPAGVDLPIHTPMMISAVNATTGERTFALAEGRVDGFLTRAVAQTKGSGLDYLLFGTVTPDNGTEGVYETPFEAGKSGSIQPGMIAEFEGPDYLKTDAGTGQLTSATNAGTELTAKGGKFLAAQAGEMVLYIVLANLSANPKAANGVRLQIKKVESYLKPAAA
jgi:hypothetical protein